MEKYEKMDKISSQLIFCIFYRFYEILAFSDAFFSQISKKSKLFSIDSRQNFYFYSLETHSLYKTRSLSGEFDLFLDLLDAGINNECISDIEFNSRDEFALLFDCIGELYFFSRSGKLIRRYAINVERPIKVIALEKSWIILNRNGMIQFIDQDPVYLEIGELIILDAIFKGNKLYLLTKSELIIIDLVNIQ